MIVVVLAASVGARERDSLHAVLDEFGLRHQTVQARDGRTYWSVNGPEDLVGRLESGPGVERVITFETPWGLVARETREAPTAVPFGRTLIGGGELTVMAGPCSVESLGQLESIARAVRSSGAHGLRGGAFKPRTSPHDFQGLGLEGLELLKRVSATTGLPVVTEVMTPEDVDVVAEHADMLQVGSRNVQNFRLLEAVGASELPVLLKRGMMSTLDEYLAAAEYVYLRGNTNIVLCERGIRTFEPRLRNTLDLAGAALLKRLTHLPVIVDPSHGTGRADLVPDLSRAAVALGADGLLVEVHPRPESALSDGAQSLRLEAFTALMSDLETLAAAVGRPLAKPSAEPLLGSAGASPTA